MTSFKISFVLLVTVRLKSHDNRSKIPKILSAYYMTVWYAKKILYRAQINKKCYMK